MRTIENRRGFVKKIGLFSTLCLTGVDQSFALSSGNSSGLVLKAREGEVRYIGNTRKAKVIIKISKTPEYTPEISLLTEIISPGDGIPVHKHLNEEEFLFVQKGKVEIFLGDNTETGEAGDLIYVPKATWHGFQNNSQEDVVLFFGYSPAGFEDYFRAIGTTEISEDLGFSSEDWIKTNEQYGVVYKN